MNGWKRKDRNGSMNIRSANRNAESAIPPGFVRIRAETGIRGRETERDALLRSQQECCTEQEELKQLREENQHLTVRLEEQRLLLQELEEKRTSY